MNNGIFIQNNYNELFVNNSLPVNGIGKNNNIDGINGPNFGLYNPDNIVLVFDTSKEPSNLQVSVPLNGTVNCIIFWGDGTSERHTTTGFKTHIYEKPGIYIVQIQGRMTTLSFGSGESSTNNKLKLVRCLSFGETGLTSLSSGFMNCPNLIQAPQTLPRESTVTNLAACFSGCRAFNDARVGGWDTSAVTALNSAFSGATAFNADIGRWNTARVTNMFAVFNGASAFNQNIGGWSTASATTFQQMFNNASAFNQDISSWNTSSVTIMTAMFDTAPSFNANIGAWNTSAVTHMDSMFRNASAFSQDISGWDIRRVTTMGFMFSGSSWGTSNYDAALTAWADLADGDLRSQAITAFATLSGGTQTRVTSNGHGMVAGSRVNISGTTNYDGDYNVLAVTANTFDISKTFVSNDATGTMKHRRSRNVVAGFGTNKYSIGTPTTKRGVLTGTYLWTITDGGQA